MANIRAAQNGDFSATSTWVGGVVPGSGDVAYANTFTVTISDTRTVQAVSNASATGITAGGSFSLLNGCNLTYTNANGIIATQVNGGVSPLITSSLGAGSSCVVVGDAANAAGAQSVSLINHSGSGIINYIGNITGQTSASWENQVGILVQGNGTLNFTGNVRGSTVGVATGYGIHVTGAATVNITGNLLAASAGCNAILLANAGCSVTVTGSATGLAVTNNNGVLTLNGTCQSSTTQPAIGAGSVTQITRLSGPFLLGASGNINPVQAQTWRWAPTQIPTYMEVPTSGGSTKRNLFSADNMPTGGYPVVANVRQSTVYGPSSEFTGTLAVPSPSSVALGVATDNTVGTAVLTADSVRSAIGLASANLDTQFSGIPAAVWAAATRTLTTAIPTAADVASAVWSAAVRTITGGTVDTLTNSPNVPSAATIASAVWSAVTRTLTSSSDPSAATIATAVRSELTTELGRIDASVSSRLAPSGTLARVTLVDTVTSLTNAPTVPSAAAIASQVRAELGVELGRIDAAISTRLAAAAYTAPPTTAAIRTELSVELARLDAAVSSRLAASSYTAPTTPPSAASIASTVWSNATRTITGGTIDNALSSAPTAATVAAAVRTELAPELARVSNCSTVDTTATTIQDALSPD